MTRPVADIERVAELISAGVSQAEAAPADGGSHEARFRGWIKVGPDEAIKHRREAHGGVAHVQVLAAESSSGAPHAPYAYLLGLYLGDGSIASHPRGRP